MIIFDVEQGSPEWLACRAGKITASNFQEVRKRLKSGQSKGDFTAAAHKYARRIALERVTGRLIDEDRFNSWAMKRGTELEEAARLKHEDLIGSFIEQVGFICDDDELYGASADGLIGDHSGAEYKCLVDPDRIMAVVIDEDISEFTDQIQGCMMITGRSQWEFCMYTPQLEGTSLELVRYVVDRDENYIADLRKDLDLFNNLVLKYFRALQKRMEQLDSKTMKPADVEQVEGIFG